jgi:hypothetical protein
MGTKNNPGAYDCYANAEPDEPMFVLLGRDPMASSLVKMWAVLRELAGESPSKVKEAEACALSMSDWALKLGKSPQQLIVQCDIEDGHPVLNVKIAPHVYKGGPS